MALTDNLVSYWKLDEASGNRADSHGSNTLTDNNTVGAAAAVINDGANFVRANSEHLSLSGSGLQPGTTDFTITAWIKQSGDQVDFENYTFIGRADQFGSGGERGWRLFSQHAAHTLRILFAPGDGGSPVGDIISFGLTPDTWYFVELFYDYSASQLSASLDDGSRVTVTGSAPLLATLATDFGIGGSLGLIPGDFLEGMVDEVGYWTRELTSGERTELYNSGDGLSYDEFGGGGGGGNRRRRILIGGAA